ncbi:hypothetical protein [Gloeocapsa sp. PCC 73106]|uniref:hypothetical protein n=1 Tax=Gloeocapsa sp. PCC 73106 TaxID=102232 RepID=UPI0002ACC529|nr:hypothetical protein [Gloeocapsa sp. PCC 73106]ELR99564.1 hypothetical protein GLO73106DRAFT_00034160 [Gloeocapsa sp. PCC 73106]
MFTCNFSIAKLVLTLLGFSVFSGVFGTSHPQFDPVQQQRSIQENQRRIQESQQQREQQRQELQDQDQQRQEQLEQQRQIRERRLREP